MPSTDPTAQEGPERPPRRAHALELVLDEHDDLEVRRRWAALEEAGVASLARHTGTTHRPHVTLLSGPRPPDAVIAAAGRDVEPLLPTSLPVAGLALLGAPGRVTLVELLCAPASLRGAQEELLGRWPGADRRPWVPHLTLARRLPPASVAAALQALQGVAPGDGATRRRVVGLRWWDPDRGLVLPLGPGGQSASSQ